MRAILKQTALLTAAVFLSTVMAVTARAASLTPVTATLPVTCRGGGTFTIAPLDGTTYLPEEAKIVIPADTGSGTFTITFDEPGNYKYRITQEKVHADGIVYDETIYDATVSVLTGDGMTLTSLLTLSSPGTETKPARIEYKNEAFCLIDPPVRKEITGQQPPKDETFTFKLTPAGWPEAVGAADVPMPAGTVAGEKTMTITGAGTKEFGEIRFTKAGTYTYQVTELDEKKRGYEYDRSVYSVVAVVTEDGPFLKVTTTHLKDGNAADSIVFTNRYSSSGTNRRSSSGGGGGGGTGRGAYVFTPAQNPQGPTPGTASQTVSEGPATEEQRGVMGAVRNHAPKTGDHAPIIPVAILFIAAAAGFAITRHRGKKKDEN